MCDNRKRGAIKAAETRKAKKATKQHTKSIVDTYGDTYSCGICGVVWSAETTAVEDWIGCEKCDQWFHWTCLGIETEPYEYL